MFDREQLNRIEAQNREILRLLRRVYQEIEEFEEEPGPAVSAVLQISKGENGMFTKATFTEFDASGKVAPRSGPITFASDNAAVVIDSSKQTVNADGSVSCPLVEVPGATAQVANVTGVDPASTNKVAAGAVDNVPAAAGAVATTATLVLS